MDHQDRAARFITQAAVTACVLVVLLVAARVVLGEVGVQLVVLGSLVALMACAYRKVTGRPVPGLRRLRRKAAAEQDETLDAWRSERWIAEAVERGLRALDEWRLEQREA